MCFLFQMTNAKPTTIVMVIVWSALNFGLENDVTTFSVATPSNQLLNFIWVWQNNS